MKRFLIFALLGPPLGFVTAFWILLQILNWALGAPSTADYHQVVLLPMAYMVGIIPALLAALFDHVMIRRRHRVLLTTAFGYAVSFIPLLGALSMGFIHGPFLFVWGLIGAVPGAVCSWLATDKQRESIIT